MAKNNNLPQKTQSKDDVDAVDAYESTYMGGEPALFRDKAHANWRAPTYAGTMAVSITLWSATHGLGLGLGLALGGGVALLGLVFAVVRVKVTSEFVDVHYGIFGPKIPLSAIESVEAVVHDYTSPLRWGISPLGRGKWLYSISGDKGRAVKIVWRTSSGKTRTHYIGSHNHEELAASIQAASAAQRADTEPKKLGAGAPPEQP